MARFSALSVTELSIMRDIFDEKLLRIYLQKRLPCYEWRERKWIQRTIMLVDEYYKKKAQNEMCSREAAILADKYEITEKNGEKIIRMKKNINKMVTLQIIAMEDYFDVLYEAHISTGHGDRHKMHDYLRSLKIYMPLIAAQCFLSLCKECEARKPTRKKKLVLPFKKNRGFVELVDMRYYADGEYKYIMHFRDLTSDCTFLRPLRSPTVIDVALELLKLFLQIGCPGIIHMPIEKSFTEAIVQRLSLAWPDCLILCGKPMKPMKKISGIEAKVHKWMSDNSSKNWTVGIYFVANQMNLSRNEKKQGSDSTPFKNLLGKNPRKGLNTRRLQVDLKDVKREEDLKKINYVDYSDESSESDSGEESEVETEAKKPDAIAENLPGPSNAPQGVAKTVVDTLLEVKQGEMFHVKHLPTKTYSKKNKAQAPTTAQGSLESTADDANETEATTSKKRKANCQSYQKLTKLTPKTDTGDSKKALCVDGNIKGISTFERMNGMERKRQLSWNNVKIDLPDAYPKDKHGNDLALTVNSEEIFLLSDGFGKANVEIDTNFTETDNTGNVFIASEFASKITKEYTSSFEKEDQNFGTIVKVESLTTEIEPF